MVNVKLGHEKYKLNCVNIQINSTLYFMFYLHA